MQARAIEMKMFMMQTVIVCEGFWSGKLKLTVGHLSSCAVVVVVMQS